MTGNTQDVFPLSKVSYSDLTARAQETYNFQKIAGRLADYGFSCILLSDDWNGADFLAYHFNKELMLKVQLKGRLTFQGKYRGQDLYIAFRDRVENTDRYYLYPHDSLRQELHEAGFVTDKSPVQWRVHWNRSWNYVPQKIRPFLEKYEI
jgi:hypothetical protein